METKQNFYQRGEGEAGGIIGIVVLVLIGLIAWGVFGVSFGVENDGIVKYDDCRQVINIKQGDWLTYTKQFTCTYRKTKSGAIMGGECVHTDNDSSFFGSSHTCATAYVYEKTPDSSCKDNTKNGVNYPYLGYDDMCYTTPQ